MNKPLLIKVAIGYVAGIVIGLFLFGSPSYSKQFRHEYQAELDRFVSIVHSEYYKLYEDRPALHPLHGEELENVEWAEHFAESEAFDAESRRIARYIQYFNALNSAAFILFMIALAGKPILGHLDGQIQEIRQRLDDAAAARKQAGTRKASAESRMEAWQQEASQIQEKAEAELARCLAEVEREEAESRAAIERHAEERRQMEAEALAQTIHRELVSEAIGQLEKRYNAEKSVEELERSVDHFTTLIERLT